MRLPVSGILLCALSVAQAEVDVFGSQEFLPTLEGAPAWNSAHWADGHARRVKYDADPYDPTDWTDDHSGSTDGFWIDGAGTMTMSGGSPRFHINSLRQGDSGTQFFKNTEFTAYYRRAGTIGAAYGGLVVGARSGPLGHASSGGDDCDATTYYARFRHDGKWDFEKELKHPTSDYWSGSGFHTQDPLWGGRTLPEHRWIGIKYLVWNLPNDRGVHLESWIDSVSGGVPSAAVWSRVGIVEDTGTFAAAGAPITGCSYTDPRTMILTGHGTFLLRTDGDSAQYRMITLREIVPPSGPLAVPSRGMAVPGTRSGWHLELSGSWGRPSGTRSLLAVSADGRQIAIGR